MKKEKQEPVTIELDDNVPGMVIEPTPIPERIIPDDWDIFEEDKK